MTLRSATTRQFGALAIGLRPAAQICKAQVFDFGDRCVKPPTGARSMNADRLELESPSLLVAKLTAEVSADSPFLPTLIGDGSRGNSRYAVGSRRDRHPPSLGRQELECFATLTRTSTS